MTILVLVFVFASNLITTRIFGKNTFSLFKAKYICVGEGEEGNYYRTKDCCPGLKPISGFPNPDKGTAGEGTFAAIDPPPCLTTFGGYFICSKCGDGICDEHENECSCPEDCAKDS